MEKQQLEHLIERAAMKVDAKKTSDICRYIPVPTGGHIHHFTMLKMVKENPQELSEMISKYIIHVSSPQKVTPKQRAARGSRKRRDLYTFSKQELEKMLHMARLAKDTEMIRKLTPKKDLRSVRKELLSSIRHGRADQELWNLYVELITCQQPADSTLQTVGFAAVTA